MSATAQLMAGWSVRSAQPDVILIAGSLAIWAYSRQYSEKKTMLIVRWQLKVAEGRKKPEAASDWRIFRTAKSVLNFVGPAGMVSIVRISERAYAWRMTAATGGDYKLIFTVSSSFDNNKNSRFALGG